MPSKGRYWLSLKIYTNLVCSQIKKHNFDAIYFLSECLILIWVLLHFWESLFRFVFDLLISDHSLNTFNFFFLFSQLSLELSLYRLFLFRIPSSLITHILKLSLFTPFLIFQVSYFLGNATFVFLDSSMFSLLISNLSSNTLDFFDDLLVCLTLFSLSYSEVPLFLDELFLLESFKFLLLCWCFGLELWLIFNFLSLSFITYTLVIFIKSFNFRFMLR